MANGAKQTLMGHEINRARLRILSPISEDTSLSPVPSPRRKDDENVENLKYPRDHQLVLISDHLHGFEPSSPDIIPPIPSPEPYQHRSRELDAIVGRYLARQALPKSQRAHDVAFCECCENINTVNREKRKLYWGKPTRAAEHEADPGKLGLDLVPYGLADRNMDEDRPVFEGRYQMMYPTLAARAAAPLDPNDRGSASLLYPYIPRTYPVGFDNYYNEWARPRNITNPPYERHLAEDVMQAASNYDSSMGKLRNTVQVFSNDTMPKGSFS